ncbi:hypothetical protein ACQKC8_10840 [Stutzerimonas stutzeri]|jgi:hypothetical protein|uniref:hypothetical protein n=1 Tax=Stutzerimonas stutzeri TaxID=316 RepID=UPI003C30D593
MRWLSLTLITALGILAFIDTLARTRPLLAPFPERSQLQFVDTTLASVNSSEVCGARWRGGKACRWVILLEADDARVWELMLEPLLERQDHRYALLQPGDRLRLGQFQGRAYTLQRLAAKTRTPGLEAPATLLSEAALYDWRYRWLVVQALWLMLDALVIAAVLYVLWKRRRTHTGNQHRLAHAIVLTVLTGTLWSWRPQPLPEERVLVDSHVRFLAVGERLNCAAGWSRPTRCQPQRFLLDDQAQAWPLAYPASQPLSIARGAELKLGMHDGRVYRISYVETAADEPQKCGYRQNPLARRNDVIWLCEDDLRIIDRGRDPLRAAQTQAAQRLVELKLLPPMPYRWTEQAYLEARAWHNSLLSVALLGLGALLVHLLMSLRVSSGNLKRPTVLR